MATPDKGKTMSSRLLTMKFMQRASAKQSDPSTLPVPPATKKMRLSDGSAISTPQSDAEAVSEALAAEEQRRAEALEREGAARGETKWYLSFQQPPVASKKAAPFRIVSAGFSSLDADPVVRGGEDQDGEGFTEPRLAGRRNFGKFNRKDEDQQDSDSSASESDDDESKLNLPEGRKDDPTGANAMINKARLQAALQAKAQSSAKRTSDLAGFQRQDAEPRHKKVRPHPSDPYENYDDKSRSGRSKVKKGSLHHDFQGRCKRCGGVFHAYQACDEAARVPLLGQGIPGVSTRHPNFSKRRSI